MAAGDLSFARFPITLDINAALDSAPQVGILNALFPTTSFDVILFEILPMTGIGGKSKTSVVVVGREI